MTKGKVKKKGSTEGFDVFSVDEIIGNTDIPNLTKDVEQPVHTTPMKGADQTKHPSQDEVTIEGIPYEDTPHRTSLKPNPILSEKGKEEEKKVEDKKVVMDTPLAKRKLDLEKESEKKKVKLTTAASSEVETIEKEDETKEEEEEESVIDIKKMTPKQLMKVLEKLKI